MGVPRYSICAMVVVLCVEGLPPPPPLEVDVEEFDERLAELQQDPDVTSDERELAMGSNHIHSKDITSQCVVHDGTRLCKQDVEEPTCPIQFYRTAYLKCARKVASVTAGADNDVAAKLRQVWYTDERCLIHRTVCIITHPEAQTQYSDEVFDFTPMCKERVVFEYRYQHGDVDSANVTTTDIQNSATNMKYGTEYLVMRVNLRGQPQSDIFLELIVYERDAEGRIVVAPEVMDRDTDRSHLKHVQGDMTGVYAHLKMRMQTYLTPNGTAENSSLSFDLQYKVTAFPMLSHCSAEDQRAWNQTLLVVDAVDTKSSNPTPWAAAGVVAALSVVCAICSFLISCLVARRQRRAKQLRVVAVTDQGEVWFFFFFVNLSKKYMQNFV